VNPTEALEKVRGALGRLKVFPLPSVVVFPGTAMPLHIFEQRYRDMVRDAVASDGVFALANVTLAGDPRPGGKPALKPILCVGTIAMHESMPDGRYNLVLAGAVRARVLREHDQTHLYREVEAELLMDPPYAGSLDIQLQRAVLDLTARLPPEVASQVAKVASRAKGGPLADVVASTIVSDLERRQELLEELDPGQRLDAVLGEVSLLLARMQKPPTPGAGFLN
jgi:Lon protease-like protein